MGERKVKKLEPCKAIERHGAGIAADFMKVLYIRASRLYNSPVFSILLRKGSLGLWSSPVVLPYQARSI